MAVFYLARLALSLNLPNLPLSVPAWYLPLTGAVWAGVGLALAVGLWRGARRAHRLAFWAAPVYLTWYWLDRLLLAHSDFAQRSLPAALVLSLAGSALFYLALTRRSARDYFREQQHA